MVYRPQVDERLCFVLMPFQDPFNGYYEHIIKPAISSLNLDPKRADEIFGTTSIIRDIWKHIWRARLIIADVSGRNANVNYELGMCHALGVPTILITQTMDDVPFDYRHRRCIVYRTADATWNTKLKNDLEKTIAACLNGSAPDDELEWPYQAIPADPTPDVKISSGRDARQKVMSGIEITRNLLARSLSSRGINVSIRGSELGTVASRQGVTLARSVHSEDHLIERGIEQMRNIATVLHDRIGDGTKTAVLLTHRIVTEGQVAIDRGCRADDVLWGIEKASTVAAAALVVNSKVTTGETLLQIALTAAGDRTIAASVLDAMKASGKDGIVLLDPKPGPQTKVVVTEGLRLPRGYLSDKFINNTQTAECVLANCRILIVDRQISDIKEVIPILGQIKQSGEPLLIIADDVDTEILATLTINNERGMISCAAVRAPGSGDTRRDMLHDLAILTGAQMFDAHLGRKLDSARLEDLGTAEKVIVTRTRTTILGGGGLTESIRRHADTLRVAIDRGNDPAEKQKLQSRLANVAGKIATIILGGQTEDDTEEKKYLCTSALLSCHAAIEEGWSIGGGVAFLNAREAIANLSFKGDGEKAGAFALERALAEPFLCIAKIAGKNPQNELQRRDEHGQSAQGLSLATDQLEDLTISGVLDPTKMLRVALEVATAQASRILKTDLWLS